MTTIREAGLDSGLVCAFHGQLSGKQSNGITYTCPGCHWGSAPTEPARPASETSDKAWEKVRTAALALDPHEQICAQNEEIDRLRKELEAAVKASNAYERAWEGRDCGGHEATISKLRAFSEDQARQIQKLEVTLGCDRETMAIDMGIIRDLERKLAKRGKP